MTRNTAQKSLPVTDDVQQAASNRHELNIHVHKTSIEIYWKIHFRLTIIVYWKNIFLFMKSVKQKSLFCFTDFIKRKKWCMSKYMYMILYLSRCTDSIKAILQFGCVWVYSKQKTYSYWVNITFTTRGTITQQSHHNMVISVQNTHKNTPIAYPKGRAMGCLSWYWSQIHAVWSLQCGVWYLYTGRCYDEIWPQ